MPFVFGIFSAHSIELKTGDILLQPLNCWSCSLIEAQEESIYSHMGVYFKLDDSEFVLEAAQTVRFTPLSEFLKKTERGQKILIKRFKSILFTQSDLVERALEFEGLSYDEKFLWNNSDALGEKLYCSELVFKLFDSFYTQKLPLKKMRYDVHREHWEKFFNGDVPDGLWGNSPADFEHSDLFRNVGEL